MNYEPHEYLERLTDQKVFQVVGRRASPIEEGGRGRYDGGSSYALEAEDGEKDAFTDQDNFDEPRFAIICCDDERCSFSISVM